MEKYEMSALDAYLNKAYRIIILMTPSAAMFSAIVYTVFKIIGWYPDISTPLLIAYDVLNIIYTSIAIYLFKTSLAENGILKKNRLKIGKIFISVVLLIQWNHISYLIPHREWWAYAFFFMVLSVFFFDMKLTLLLSLEIIISTSISWYFNGENLMVASGQYYKPDLFMRIICILFTTATILALTHFGSKFLVEDLEKHVNYDTLTHLLNRRSMDSYLNAALRAAERIRNDVAKDPIKYTNNISVPVTITIGISEYKNGISIKEMMKDADSKLYYGKRHGKNQLVSNI
ncbi:GGDEF domain-containing protein [Pseudobutyrivibrio xylanivorans]|uniref:Diguanylate cyclase n=1 Tax=Pseudobutyrivibrio xylanivorans TaxID=185007 RepID=A0A5P6VVV4_PSEXY|nr:diguanylate cyclase [Pseudobutyrivibrio xylanivorans]QFJ56349.1 diguanylate cyclase [Pseudobutyrivibrio xylanivorans]